MRFKDRMAATPLSVIIITYNEEKNIRACLESVKWADEIIIVDSFSTDQTIAICRQYTQKIFQQEWQGYVHQKQFALDQAEGPWILNLDADERLSTEAADEIKNAVINGSPAADGYLFPRRSYYLGRWINHGGWYPDYKLRLIRKGKARYGGVDPHDKIILTGPTRTLKGEILHYVYKNLSHQLTTVDAFSTVAATQWHQQGKKFNPFLIILRPPIRFLEMYIWKKGFLDGFPGFVIAAASSFYVFLKYAKLWVLQHDINNDSMK